MLGDVVQPDGDGVVDEHPEHSVALWQSADQMTRFLVDALVDELGELVVVPPHSQRPVSGVHQFHCRVHDCPQRRVEVQSEVTTSIASTKPSRRSRPLTI